MQLGGTIYRLSMDEFVEHAIATGSLQNADQFDISSLFPALLSKINSANQEIRLQILDFLSQYPSEWKPQSCYNLLLRLNCGEAFQLLDPSFVKDILKQNWKIESCIGIATRLVTLDLEIQENQTLVNKMIESLSILSADQIPLQIQQLLLLSKKG